MKVVFNGRRAGSIGCTYLITDEVLNDPTVDYEACRLELYNMGYEYVVFIKKVEDWLEEESP